MNKNIIAFFVLHLLLFFGSCNGSDEPLCDCSSTGLEELRFTALEPIVLEDADVTDGQFSPYSNTIDYNDFLLRLNLTTKKVNDGVGGLKSISKFGFSTAYACTCAIPQTILHRIESIQILQKTIDGTVYEEISDAFGVLHFLKDGNELTSIDEALQASRTAEENLWVVTNYDLRLVQKEEILPEAIFKVVITLSNEQKFEKETSLIVFNQS